MLEVCLPRSRGAAVLHWFTETKAEAERAVRLGACFSINRQMLQSDRHRSLAASLPLDRILTETDGPSTKTGHRPTRPADVSRTVDELAALRSMSRSELSEIILGNLKRIVSE
jgi:TatD DNase family protein